jgi:phenylacetate-CoA ligase
MLGGQLITPSSQRRPPFWVWNAALNQLYMSSYHLATDLIPYYFDALKHYRISYIFGYTSSLYAIAREALQTGRKDLRMTVAITNAEPVFDYQRWAIAEAFQCPVRETYGMAEIVAGASECSAGKLHLWPEVGWVEVFEGTQPIDSDAPGALVCTGLLNADMPLIRYRVGDSGVQPAVYEACSCRRTLPMLASIEGRADDLLYTSDGRRIGRLDPVFKTQLPVREVQIIQEALDKIRVRYVPTTDFTPAIACLLVQRLQERLGMVEVLLERVDKIPRERNGKFRAVLCNLPTEEREHLQKAD